MNVPIIAEPIAHFGSFTITNAFFNAIISSIALLAIGFFATRRLAFVPRGAQNAFESFIDFGLSAIDSVTHDRNRSKKFFPLLATLFLFILVNNWLGQLPGTGSIGVWERVAGEIELVPLLRPATSDLNLTLALSIFAIGATHIFGIAAVGVWKHLNKFLQFGALWRSLTRGPIAIFTACVEFVVGIIEMIGEFTKMISLSLRLFGNIFAGEVLITVMLSLVAYVLPLPFQALEALVGIVQATVFTMLVLVFMTIATEPAHS